MAAYCAYHIAPNIANCFPAVGSFRILLARATALCFNALSPYIIYHHERLQARTFIRTGVNLDFGVQQRGPALQRSALSPTLLPAAVTDV